MSVGPAARSGEDRGDPVDLRTRVGSVELANPVMTASGTSGHGAELAAYVDLAALGAVVVKSVSAGVWAGNPAPRLLPLDAAMLNSVGLQNGGVAHWLAEELPLLAGAGAVVVASIWGFRAEEYRRVAGAIAGAGSPSIVAVEANISCPNVEDRRRMFAHSAGGVAEAVTAAVEGLAGRLPLWAKLSPNVTDLPEMARAAAAAGAEAVTLVNTVMGMAIDPASGRARLGGGGGGLSGPAIHPIAVRAVFECRSALPSVPIVGVGGIVDGAGAAEMLAAGASAVQVGTATFADPRAPARVLSGLREWCAANGISKIDELKGRAHDPS
ncbi:MAG: dihydroorotate dehydrogenase [Acidimicrobiales bacterium]